MRKTQHILYRGKRSRSAVSYNNKRSQLYSASVRPSVRPTGFTAALGVVVYASNKFLSGSSGKKNPQQASVRVRPTLVPCRYTPRQPGACRPIESGEILSGRVLLPAEGRTKHSHIRRPTDRSRSHQKGFLVVRPSAVHFCANFTAPAAFQINRLWKWNYYHVAVQNWLGDRDGR